MVHRAASKYATDLMRQVQDLAGRGGAVTPVERPQFDDGVSARGAVLPDFYVQDLTDAAAFFAANGSYEPGWYVELRPTNFDPQRVSDRAGLRRLREDAVVGLRGWDFPHVDKEEMPFERGLQSNTAWSSHIEGHRIYNSGLFVWRERYVGDLPDIFGSDGNPNGMSFLAVIWSMVEFMLFSARYLHDLVPDEEGTVTIEASGLLNRYIYSDVPGVDFLTLPRTGAQGFRRTAAATGIGWELSWQDACLEWTDEFFGLFGLEISRPVIRDWQTRLLERRF